ncbi:uncharacterized protein [Antedon mediterranea]|uniref:uncharacterized protein n=1 Tax=Antedon mediterranea TaxID=105859 RepID=UPI003AF5F56F
MDDHSLMMSSSHDQSSVSMDAQLKDIFGDDDLFSDSPMETTTNANPFDSLLSQAAAEAGVFPFMDDLDEPIDSTTTEPVQTQPPLVTNQLVIPTGQPMVPQPTLQQQTLSQKVNTMPMFNQTLQPMMTNQSGQPTTAVLQVGPSGQQIIQQIPANAQGGQQIVIQGLVPQLASVKTSQGIIGTVQLQQGLQGQQQPLTSFVLNTGGTRIPIQTVINSPLQQKLGKAIKSGPVAISPKPISKGPRHISPKPLPGQKVIQILQNQPMTRTLQIAQRAPGQPQTFLIRNPNIPGNLQLVQGINAGQTVIANSGMVRAPNYQVIQGNNPPVTNMLQSRMTTQSSSNLASTPPTTTSSKRKSRNNAQSNTQTTQSKSIASSGNLTSSSFVSNSMNFTQPVNSQPTIVTVTETGNKTLNPVITIGASGSMIFVKQSKPITVTAKNPGLGTDTVPSFSIQKSMVQSNIPNQQTVLTSTKEIKVEHQPSGSFSGSSNIGISDPRMPFNANNSGSYQVPSPQLGRTLTKQQNIPAFVNPSQSVSQSNTMTSFVNTGSNQIQYSTSSLQTVAQQNSGVQNTGVHNQTFTHQVPTPSISLTHRKVEIQTDSASSSSFSVGLPLPHQPALSQPLQASPSVVQNDGMKEPAANTGDLRTANLHNKNILKEMILKHPAVFQNSLKNNPQMQQKFQVMLQQFQQQNAATNSMQNVAGNASQSATQPQPTGSITLVHNQSNPPSQVTFQSNSQTSQVIGVPHTQVNQPVLNANSNLGNSIQPVISQQQPVISAQAAAIMKYPPKKQTVKNAKPASTPSFSTSSSINPNSIQKSVVQQSVVTTSSVATTPATNQGLNLPQTFQISIKAQEQLQTIQNHIRTLTGMPSLNDQQSRLLQQLQIIQQKIVTQARQQMLVQQQQTRQPAVNTVILPQPSGGKGNKKIASKSPKQNTTSPAGSDTLTVKQETNVNIGVKSINLTPTQQQIVKSVQEKLKTMTPEEQQAYIKSQQSLLLNLQQQKQAKQGQTSSGTQFIKIESKGTKRPAQYQLTRSSLMLHQVKQNQEKMIGPDLKTPFKNYKDAIHRLVDYHVVTDHTPTSDQLEEIDEAFEEVSATILEKKQKMYNKYQQLIMQDSMKTSESSEMVMLGRMMLQDEKNHFEEEKQMPQDQLIAKIRTLPGFELNEDDADLKSQTKESDVSTDLLSPVKSDIAETQDNIGLDATELQTKFVPEVVKKEEIPSSDIVSLDVRTTDKSAEMLELGPKDCNGFITRELTVNDEGRQKPLKLKIKLRRPSTLQDLLGEQEHGLEVNDSLSPTFDNSLNGEVNPNSNSYDAFEMSDIEDDLDEKRVDTQNTKDGSVASDVASEEEDEDTEENSCGALSEQNESAINHILSFRNNENPTIPSSHDNRTDVYKSTDDRIVNGLEYEFDDDDDADDLTIPSFSRIQRSSKLEESFDDFDKTNSSYDEFSTMSNLRDPDLEEAVNSILF